MATHGDGGSNDRLCRTEGGYASPTAALGAVIEVRNCVRFAPYPCVVSLDPAEVIARVQAKYAPMRRSEVALYLLAMILLAVVSLFREVDWYMFVGVLVAAAAWEVTKYRLPRNARDFVSASHP